VAKSAPLTVELAGGTWGTVECVAEPNGHAPAVEFLSGEPPVVQARFLVLFQQMANYGSVQAKRFKKEMGDFSAFRHEINNLQYRFPCFRDGNKWIITHGFIKPGARNKKLGEWPVQQVERAERIQREHQTRKRALTGGKK
jgi:hypothetical protein